MNGMNGGMGTGMGGGTGGGMGGGMGGMQGSLNMNNMSGGMQGGGNGNMMGMGGMQGMGMMGGGRNMMGMVCLCVFALYVGVCVCAGVCVRVCEHVCASLRACVRVQHSCACPTMRFIFSNKCISARPFCTLSPLHLPLPFPYPPCLSLARSIAFAMFLLVPPNAFLPGNGPAGNEPAGRWHERRENDGWRQRCRYTPA